MRKDDPNVHVFQNKNWSIIFFLTLTVRGPYHRKDSKWKKYGGTRLISDKTEALYVELNERAETATNNFLQYSCSVTMINNCEGKFMN